MAGRRWYQRWFCVARVRSRLYPDPLPTRYGIAPYAPFPGNFLTQERAFLSNYRVATIILDPVGAQSAKVAAYHAKSLAERPTFIGGVDAWYVQGDLARFTTASVRHEPSGSSDVLIAKRWRDD